MKLTIYRGTHEIGGTCIQLFTDKTTILLDLGQALKKDTKDPDLAGLKIHGVLISHPHADHFGLIDILEKGVPVYIGELGHRLINATRVLLGKELYQNNFQYFKAWKPFRIGDFKITPYLVDHSATDAYAFLIEAEGKKVFYSGDFRGHGRKSILYKKILNKPPKNIDLLFLEGSMLNRENGEFSTEASVEKKILEAIKEQKNITFLICSSQNIDRIVSAYRACLQAKKTLILDFYTAWVLEQMKIVTENVPAMNWNNVRVYADYGQDKKLKANPEYFGDFRQRVYAKYRIRKEELYAHPEKYVCISKISKFRVIDAYKKNGTVNVIYSQWRGYIDNPEYKSFGSDRIAAYQDDPMVNFVSAHTSGHAPLKDLQKFAKALKPQKLIPIHTEHALSFNKHFENVLQMHDEKELYL